MDTYLIDTNVISVLYDATRPNHGSVRQAVGELGQGSVQLISAVTIAELRFGLALSRAGGAANGSYRGVYPECRAAPTR